ncbi:MAG: hypothetical protein QOE52_2146, partial [Mycobacterium sp.]|nr:hypothetical protein [Mycobacterium sp.]
EDVAWSYQDPPPESLPIKGFLSFDATRAEVVAELPEAPSRQDTAAQDTGGE